jgi:hypothetical protein
VKPTIEIDFNEEGYPEQYGVRGFTNPNTVRRVVILIHHALTGVELQERAFDGLNNTPDQPRLRLHREEEEPES